MAPFFSHPYVRVEKNEGKREGNDNKKKRKTEDGKKRRTTDRPTT
jgi:hypothetical protein